MSFASKRNNSVRFDVDTNGFTFKKLVDLYNKDGAGKIYEVKGLFINTKGHYGDNPIAILKNCFVSLPSHLTSEVKDILHDDEDVKSIKLGLVGFRIYTYQSNNKTCYSINWVDIEPEDMQF